MFWILALPLALISPLTVIVWLGTGGVCIDAANELACEPWPLVVLDARAFTLLPDTLGDDEAVAVAEADNSVCWFVAASNLNDSFAAAALVNAPERILCSSIRAAISFFILAISASFACMRAIMMGSLVFATLTVALADTVTVASFVVAGELVAVADGKALVVVTFAMSFECLMLFNI